MPTEQEQFYKEQRASLKKANDLKYGQAKYAAIAQGLQQIRDISVAFDDNPYETGTADEVSILAGAASGAASGAAAGAVFGPKGAAIGAIVGGSISLVSGLLGESEKKKQAHRQWQQALNSYKSQLKDRQLQLTGQARTLEKRAKTQLGAIGEATKQAVISLERQGANLATGIEHTSKERRIEAMEDNSIDLQEQTYDSLMSKVDILENAANVLEQERFAHRDAGVIKTDRLGQFEAEMEKLQYV